MPQGILVTASAKELRSLGRWALNGNWGTAILTSLLSTLVINIPPLILNWILGAESWINVSDVYSLLVTAPLSLGVTMIYLNIFRKKQTHPVEIFYGFEFILKAVLLHIIMTLLVFFQTLLFVIPGIIAAYRYSLAYFILADDPTKSAMQCIRESKYLMTGNKMKMFGLTLSFFGWGFLASIPLSVVLLYFPESNWLRFEIAVLTATLLFCFLEPYIQVSTAAFYEIANGSLRVKRTETQYERSERFEGPNAGYNNYDTSQNMGFSNSGESTGNGGGELPRIEGVSFEEDGEPSQGSGEESPRTEETRD